MRKNVVYKWVCKAQKYNHTHCLMSTEGYLSKNESDII